MTPHAPTTIPEPAPAAPPPPTRERTPQDVLLAAARYIEEHGWTQYLAVDENGQVCVAGAINAVSSGDPTICASSDTPYMRLVMHLGVHIPEWNDAPGRTKAEVLQALRGAAW